MKIRSTFVANSSSSSFIIIYKEIPNIDVIFATGVIPAELKNKIECFDTKDLSDGCDNIHLTEEIIKEFNVNFYNVSHDINRRSFVEVVSKIYNDYYDKTEVLKEYVGCKIKMYEIDQHCTGSDLELFKCRYIEDGGEYED